MTNRGKYVLSVIAAMGVMAMVAAISYFIGKGQSVEELEAMKGEVETLRAEEREAAVVKRVSQQMEEIAAQQKEISDRQRDKAEESSKLAIQLRDRAEQESRWAHEAEGKAIVALKEAEVQRANAEQQQQIALEQRDKATLSKTIADTLTIRTQAKTMGLTSRNQREIGDTVVADLLAYASWYFLNRYKGNTYYAETFKSLTLATNSVLSYNMDKRGGVNAISMIPDGRGSCVAVSDYGEVEIFNPSDKNTTILLQDKRFDFRDVWAGKQAVYALSKEGTLCMIGYNHVLQKTVGLPTGDYFKMIRADSNTMLLAGRQGLCWYTFSSGLVSDPILLKGRLSAICKREQVFCLFFADGSYAEMDGAGKVTEKNPIIPRIVTSAHYAEDLQCLCLGLKEGPVHLINKYNRRVEMLDAHNAKTLCITTVGPVLISGAYDKAINIWKLDNLLFNTGLNFREEMQTKVAPKQKVTLRDDRAPNEWISPVEYPFRGWTLAVEGDPMAGYVWVGTATGDVIRMNISVDNMAQRVHRKLKRNFTDVEWIRWVGAAVPYIKFKE